MGTIGIVVNPNSGKDIRRLVTHATMIDNLEKVNILCRIIMGIGTALLEEYRVEEGIPLTKRWSDYTSPLMADVPEMEVHIVEHPTAEGPYGAKGIGELPSIPTAPAICNAICNATGVRLYRLPARLEPHKKTD